MAREISIISFSNNPIDCAITTLSKIDDVKIERIDGNAIDKNAIATIKRGGATLILCDNTQSDSVLNIAKTLGLYARVSCLDNGNAKCLVVSGIEYEFYDTKKSYSTSAKFGRECSDKITVSELEIERVARIAYDIATLNCTSITLCDRADLLEISRLYRKIVTDINEDYPYINVDITLIQNALKTPCNLINKVVLTHNVFADIVDSVLSHTFNASHTLLLGDMNVGAYVCTKNSNINSVIKDMMKLSFDLDI